MCTDSGAIAIIRLVSYSQACPRGSVFNIFRKANVKFRKLLYKTDLMSDYRLLHRINKKPHVKDLVQFGLKVILNDLSEFVNECFNREAACSRRDSPILWSAPGQKGFGRRLRLVWLLRPISWDGGVEFALLLWPFFKSWLNQIIPFSVFIEFACGSLIKNKEIRYNQYSGSSEYIPPHYECIIGIKR
jgi:hypothetical protein